MRKSLFGMALTLVLMSSPIWAAEDDQQIAQRIIAQLKEHKEGGRLKGFNIDLSVEKGRVWLKGDVANQDQHQLAIDTARHVPGVNLVINDLKIKGETMQHPAEKPAAGTELRQPETSLSASESQWSARSEKPQISLEPKQEKLEVLPEEVAVSASDKKQSEASVSLPERREAPQLTTSSTRSVLAQYEAPVPSQQNEVVLVTESQAPSLPEQTAAAGPTMVAYPQQQVAPPASYAPQGQGYWVAMPVQAPQGYGRQQAMPVAFAPSTLPGSPAMAPQQQMQMQQMQQMQLQQIAYAQSMQAQQGPPMPMQGMQMQPAPQFIQGTGMGVQPAQYDHPSMPGYAWPSYASYPNYAALQYPKQYSAHAWPYIGPFYPYPQVPLGWRKVTLSWDDGWWFLDFKDKGYGPYVTQ